MQRNNVAKNSTNTLNEILIIKQGDEFPIPQDLFFRNIVRKQLAGKHTHPAGHVASLGTVFARKMRARCVVTLARGLILSCSQRSYKSPYLGHDRARCRNFSSLAAPFCWPRHKNNLLGIE